jgi:hypothetical protein
MTTDEIKNYLEYALALEKKKLRIYWAYLDVQLRIKRSNGKSNVLLRKKIQLKYRYEHVRFRLCCLYQEGIVPWEYCSILPILNLLHYFELGECHTMEEALEHFRSQTSSPSLQQPNGALN